MAKSKITTYMEFGEALAKGTRVPEHSSLFIEDDRIYSFGYHYVLARRMWDSGSVRFFLLNSTPYSNTTSAQTRVIHDELTHYGTVIPVSDCDPRNLHDDFLRAIGEEQNKALRSRDLENLVEYIEIRVKNYHKYCSLLETRPMVEEHEKYIKDFLKANPKIESRLVYQKMKNK